MPQNIFGFIYPKVAVFTTPNADFNVLFEHAKFPNGFRHDDHKFEWTQQQFRDWYEYLGNVYIWVLTFEFYSFFLFFVSRSCLHRAQNICERYPDYRFSISGMGELPEGADEKLGKCSQMVTFVRKDMLEILLNDGSNDELSKSQPLEQPDSEVVFPIDKCNYKLLYRKDYPYDQDIRSADEKILDDVKYFINRHLCEEGAYFDEDRNICEFPIENIFHFVHDVADMNELRKIIRKEFVINEKDCIEQNIPVDDDYELDQSDDDYENHDNHANDLEKNTEGNQSVTSADDESWD